MATLLIDIVDIQERYNVSDNVANSRVISAAILRAQETGLILVVGKNLYDRIVAESGRPSPAIAAILPTVKTYLAAKTYAILLFDNGISVSAFGVAKKNADAMTLINPDEIRGAAETADAEAATQGRLLLQQIRENFADYPEFPSTLWPGGGDAAPMRFTVIRPPRNPNA